MQVEPLIAFISHTEPPALEVRINFGIFAGREATAAEIDDLARVLLPELGEVSIVAENRHEVSEDVEVSVHQVRVEVAGDHLPPAGPELDALEARIVDACESWADACIAERHAEVAPEA